MSLNSSPGLDDVLIGQLDQLASEASYLNDYSLESLEYCTPLEHNPPKEDEPLLPLHSRSLSSASSVRSLGSLGSGSLQDIPPLFYRMLLSGMANVVWNYVLTQRMRAFFVRNQRPIIGGMVLMSIVGGIILYFTGNLTPVIVGLRKVYCFLADNYPLYHQVCGNE